ncbi:MAG: LysR family transcriptional regulator [Erysipelotrichaceae bacterium]|jgi:DNA-binding transcriptional LysR family regulator|nr:LysR family transcriptional regulator [Erysipelotrichaceae bacterium]
MELRVLRYFLVIAREENITRAAQVLHVTQPTLSRQMMALEEELGVQLFHRGKYHVTLTEEGMLLRQRAKELVDLSDKTMRELSHHEEALIGEIAIGCGETKSMSFLSERMMCFQKENPGIAFNVYSAIADDVKERLDKGLLDIGLLMEPVDIGTYEFLRLPFRERWGIYVKADCALAKKEAVTPKDLAEVPLLMVKREFTRKELAGWFKEYNSQLKIAATYNLILNAAFMVTSGMGAAVSFDLGKVSEDLVFVPLKPALETGAVLVWKKHQLLSHAAVQFIQHIKNAI